MTCFIILSYNLKNNMGQFLKITEIKALQIEPTSKCNLACPQCARTDKGKLNPVLPLTELTPEDYERIFISELTSQLEYVVFNGNYGDPVASKHINYAIDKLLKNKIKIRMFTNGSLQTHNWWKELGDKFSKTKSEVIFSIDGLEDTNHLYRINSCFKKIMENAKVYIQAGGRARWDFLVFQHNYHQVEKAKSLAKKIGFQRFQEKRTARFIGGKYTKEENKNYCEVFNKKGEVIDHLKAPPDKRKDFEKILEKYGSWNEYINKTQIYCRYKNNMKALFIDFEGLVWPCCWIGAPIYFTDPEDPQKKQFDRLREKYKKNFNSLRQYSLMEILSHRWFDSELEESWQNQTTDHNFKLFTCGRTCGTSYEFTSEPGSKNSKMFTLQ